METVTIPGTDLEVSRIALGTWAIGGWMWGGRDEKESIDTIHAALDRGVTLIDTAPVYGFGSSEEIVGQALKKYGRHDRICISTKAGLAWDGGKPFRNAHPDRITREVEDSLQRLQTDVIDIYVIIEQLARELHDKSLLAAAVRWVLDMGVEIAIWGGRRPMQMEPIDEVMGWHVSDDLKEGVDRILSEEIQNPVGPEFMAPPAR